MKEKALPIIAIIAGLGLVGSLYYNYTQAQSLKTAEQEFASSTAEFQTRVADLEGRLALAEEERDDLEEELSDEKDRNEEFADQIDDLADTVGVLDKLSKTDKELLQKYSKVYFLNEHYTPKSISEIDKDYWYEAGKKQEILTPVRRYLENMLDEATEDNIDLKVISSYRSFGTQAAVKSGYKVTYGAGTANQFSADQGYSEHQLGTTVDLTTTAVGATFTGFDKTEAYKWLQANAHKYGFVLSYPPNNAYYIFEPWHWRFVGRDLARELYKDKNYFYDMDQRDIDKYLVSLFD